MISALESFDERCVDLEPLKTLDAGLGCEIGHCFKGVDELRAAVGVSAVVQRVHADEDIARCPSTSAHARANDRKIVLRAGT